MILASAAAASRIAFQLSSQEGIFPSRQRIARQIDSAKGRNYSTHEQFERVTKVGFHLFAMDHGIEESVLEQKFVTLEAFRQFLADGLLDNARSCEADQRSGFCDIQVAQHG